MTDYPGSGAPGAERPAYPPEYGQQPQPEYGQQPQPEYGQQPPPGQPAAGYPASDQQLPQAPPVPDGYGYGQHPQGAVPAGMYYDQESGLLLPNGTELASVGRRIGAFFLAIPLWIITLGIGYIIWGLILWGRGQTPALSVLGMRV